MYQINHWQKLRQVSHIIWDIDGTITEHDVLSKEVTVKIIILAQRSGVYHSFITGRDADWVITNVITPMKEFPYFSEVHTKMRFVAEVGCVPISLGPKGEVEPTPHPTIENHPLYKNCNRIRDKLRALAHDPESLQEYVRGAPVPSEHDVIYDANGQGYLIKPFEQPHCSPYIWSTYKKIFATFEKTRDEDGRTRTFDQEPYENKILEVIKEAGFENEITTELVGTAINIVPKVGGEPLGKSWAAGEALTTIQEDALGGAQVLDSVIYRTIAVGDGSSDLDFTKPTFPPEVARGLTNTTLQIIFVGPEQDLPRLGRQGFVLRRNIIIQATGRGSLQHDEVKEVINLIPATGPRVVSVVLDFLKDWDYFGPF
jgi:hypothetical protein